MPVVEFALDLTAQNRIQVHIPTENTTYTVMLNGSILGVLATYEELRQGKYFILPDRSNLYVRLDGPRLDGPRLQVFRDSRLLTPLTGEEKHFASSPTAQRRTSGERLLTRLKKVTR